MPKLAANLTMMFNEVPFLERFDAAARAGFKGVEILLPYAHPAAEVEKARSDAGLEIALFNLPPGDWEAGERGFGALPGREAEFEDALAKAVDYAGVLGCRRLHVMAGIPPSGTSPVDCTDTLARNVRRAADVLAPLGIDALIEPINTRDIPGYFLNRQDQALAVLDAVDRPNAKLQMDLYHCQIVEGDVSMKLRANIARIAHVQIAGVPERHEPDIGEVNYPYHLELIDSLGFDGWVGCEYRPQGETEAGLGWAKPYL